MTSSKKDDLLRKIAGLMAKAESSEFEGERQVFMAKADELMMKYSIELWELSQRESGNLSERTPIIMDFDYSWAFSSGPFPEICDALWSMFQSAAGQATCSIVFHKQHFSGETKQHKSYTIPVIGTDADLGYLSLLFTSLMTQLIEATHPKVDPNKLYEENLRTFREAGWGWLEVAKVMQDAGYDRGMTVSAARHKEAHAYRRYCKKAGIEQNYANFKTYRRNFAAGFAGRVSARLAAMRQETGEHLGTGMEIALRDQRKVNADFMFAQFPQDGRNRTSMVRDSRRFDSAAYSGGRAAGDKANISISPSKGVKGSGGRALPK
jgi:hypothetical protein